MSGAKDLSPVSLLVAVGVCLVSVGVCWWLLVAFGGGSTVLVSVSVCWWLLVAVGGCWCLLVYVSGRPTSPD